MDLEAEYNNRAKHPDFPDYLAQWNEAAAAFRAAHANAELGLAYGATARQRIDVYWPGPDRDAPLALFIHGGYWQALDASSFSHLAAGLSAHGVAVAMPTYDLCPTVSLAALTEQVRAAAAFLCRRHGRPMLATGHSAGGHLAAMLMATDWAARGLPAPAVRHALALSGLFDLPPLTHTTINGPLGLDAAEARRLSPLYLPAPGGRIHAVVGGLEGAEYERQSRSIADAWGGTWESVPGAHHLTIIAPLADPASALVRHALDLMR